MSVVLAAVSSFIGLFYLLQWTPAGRALEWTLVLWTLMALVVSGVVAWKAQQAERSWCATVNDLAWKVVEGVGVRAEMIPASREFQQDEILRTRDVLLAWCRSLEADRARLECLPEGRLLHPHWFKLEGLNESGPPLWIPDIDSGASMLARDLMELRTEVSSAWASETGVGGRA